MIIRKPQITDTLLYPEFFDKLLRQKDIQKLNYKLSDHNYSGSNFCSFESFYEPDVVTEQYETYFNMPIIEWVKKTDEPSEIEVVADSNRVNINYLKNETVKRSERDFYLELYKTNKKTKVLNFSDKHYKALEDDLKEYTKPKIIKEGLDIKGKFNILIKNSDEYTLRINTDNKDVKFELYYNKGIKKYKIINSSNVEIGELILK